VHLDWGLSDGERATGAPKTRICSMTNENTQNDNKPSTATPQDQPRQGSQQDQQQKQGGQQGTSTPGQDNKPNQDSKPGQQSR
jgi:hypothetical protein